MDGQSDREMNSSLLNDRLSKSVSEIPMEFEEIGGKVEPEFCLESLEAIECNMQETNECYHFDFNESNANDLVLDLLLWENYLDEEKKEKETTNTRVWLV